jgi:hypothetical protein
MTAGRRLAHVAIAAALAAGFWFLPEVRRDFIRDVVSNDAPPGPPPPLAAAPAGSRGVDPASHVRVVLVDGAGASTARAMPAWDGLCRSGLDLTIDVGFPTVSLPVQVALWTGLTQQQTGVLFHSGKPLARPPARSIPAQVPASIAVAESHPEIIGSIGFALAEPPIGPLPPDWDVVWIDRALAAVMAETRLAFVHLLSVDDAGHKHGRDSARWRDAAATADRALARLLAAGRATHPTALWVVLADHDHLPGGGHGGEEREIRQVRACLAGPGIAAGRGGPIHLVDLSRAIADALGATLPPEARGRPLRAAIADPLAGDAAVPAIPLGRGVPGMLVIVLGVAITAWGMQGRHARGPWWLPAAVLGLVLVEGVPTLSTPMIYKPMGRDMYLAFAPGLVVLAAMAGIALRRGPAERVVPALLALPVAALVALLIATDAWAIVAGGETAPIVPRWTAWTSAVLLMVAQAMGVVALALLATAVLPGSDRGAPTGTGRSAPGAPP